MGIFSGGSDSGKARRRIGGLILGKERENTRQLFGQSEGLLLSSLESRRKGFDQAKSAVLDQGRVARSRALAGGAAAQSNAQLALAGTGRGATSLVSPTAGGVSAQIAQSLAEIDSEVSRLFGEFSIGAGQAEAQGFESLAALQERLAQQESEQFFTPLFNVNTGTSRRGDFR